ncbi:MAG: DUF4347 domain-containing protein, partial [Planctomycetota bacterium]|nr:DUF4347 domain-containing protein [Planctomycetota bacterium]
MSDLKVKTSLAVRELLDRVQRTLQSVEPVRAGRALDLSELEERILLSVSPGIVVAEMTDAALADSMSVDTATLDSGIVTSSQTDSSTSNQQLSSSVSTDPTQTVSHEIVFLDTTVEDYQQLLDDLWSNNDPGREFEVVLLQNSRDGIEQITEALAGRTDLDAVHIVSHGTDSAVKLGSTWLTNDNLAGYVGEISRWSSALSVDADLLFYGCDLAASESGRTLLESVQTLTGADVAASTNDTGAAILGGDWELEYSVGSIETQIAFSQTVQAEWHGLLDTFTVTNTNDSGSGSLRQAIIDANSLGGTDTINFNINGGGVERIRPNSALPTITDTIIINGWSQPGFSSTPLIELRGDTAGASVDGLTFSTTSDGSIVRGLVIYDYSRDGILVQSGADNITIQGNWIGTAGTGTIGDGNGEDGIDLRGSSAIIGGTGANEGNVITNNGNEGITIQGSGVTAHLIQGNIIGLDPDGSTGVGNTDVGIAIISGSGNTIGGTTAAARNIISKNFEGIEINTANNVVSGNYIGTDITGSLDRGNRSDDGVEIQSSASGNVIGGEAVGAGNIIAFNAQNGVNVVSGTDNAIVRNSIFSNTLLGINLATAGVTANDIGDGDTGANNLQNFPVLTSAVTNGTKINIAGSFNSNASTSYRIEFYSNTTGDGTGYGEGQTLIGISDVTTNGTGEATFSSTFTAAVSAGSAISATVSRLDAGDAPIETSEFSQNVTATIDGSRDITFQNGTNSYTGTEDTELDSGSADTSKENNTTITVDLDDTGQAQGLIQFGSIFGSGPNQIPFGSTILSASLQLHVVDPAGAGDQITLHRMLVDWNESSTWNSLTGGISANDVEASSSADSTLADASVTGSVAFTGLASAVQAWSDGDSNYGWAILTNSINGWDIVSSEGATASERPQLIISYSSPPIISLPAGALIYTENDPATVIDGTATVTDSDSIDFNTGTLTVDFTANGTANDRLAILNEGTGAGQIGVSGSNVSYEGTTIGTFAGGTDGSTPLVITFNASSTPVGAQALLRNITYENVSESPSASPRTVRFVLTDGDGGTSNTATQTVNVTSVNDDPVFTSPSSVSVSENQSGVQTVTATDVDVPAQTLSFAITGGADELQFALNPTSGTLVFVSPQDFETPVDANGDNVYEVELTVSDGNGGSSIETLFVTVTNQNDNPPVVTPGQSFSVDENSANGTSLGSLMATDDDAGTTFQTWTITFDSSGGIFSLNSTTGELTVADNTNLNFESATSYTLFVRVSDGSTDSAQESVTISVGEVNEFDPVVNDQSFAVNENSTNGTVVGTVAASDADTRQSLSYVITAGNTNNAFAINSGTGQITVNNSSELDRETTASFALTVQVTDDVSPTRSDTATVTVNLNGVNDNTPVITSNGGGATAAVNVAENSTAVTTVTATDADVPTQTLSYSITGGADASLFNIDAMSGELTFASAPDFETPTDASGDNVYDFTVQVSDGNGGTVTQTIAVVVNDINELPSGSGSLTTTSLNDNAGATNLFGGLSVTDVDTGEADLSLTITLTTPSAGTISGGGFTEIEVGTGVFTATGLTTATADTALDNVQFSPTDNAGPSGTFNTDISVTVNDQGGGGEQTVLAPTTVTITRVNDAPAISLPGSALNYSENDTATLIDSTATVSDADSTIFDTGTLTIDFTANGTVSDRLAINNQGTGSG